MAKKSGYISKIASTLLITINLKVMIICILLFAISLWMISSPSTMVSVIQNYGGITLKALLPHPVLSIQTGIGIAMISIFVFFIAYMGFYGAITRSKFLLFMYTSLILLLLLLECALIYYFTSNLIEKGIQDSDGVWAHVLRLAFHCCDYHRKGLKEELPPWSCCGSEYHPSNCTQTVVHEKDCQTTITEWLENRQLIIYTSLAVIHIVLAFCSLLRRSSSASRSNS